MEDALAGARDIAAETISDHAEVRASTRRKAMQFGMLASEKIEDAKDEKTVYETYYDFNAQVNRLRPHQVLAINRGETEKVLRVKVTLEEKDWKSSIVDYFRPDMRSPFCSELELASYDAAERLLLPAIERDVRRELTVAARNACHQGLCRQPQGTAGAASAGGADRARAGPGLPHRHQAGGG